MVVYEVLSGRTPFAPDKDPIIIEKVLKGEHPVRPEGELFTDGIWKLLEDCWMFKPRKRLSANKILLRLTPQNLSMFSPFCFTGCV